MVMKKKPGLLAGALLLIIIALSCNSIYTPRPRGYYKIDFPAHSYQSFDKAGFPFRFEYPSYANIIQDSTFFEEQPENPYWLNIDFPQFYDKLYISSIAI